MFCITISEFCWEKNKRNVKLNQIEIIIVLWLGLNLYYPSTSIFLFEFLLLIYLLPVHMNMIQSNMILRLIKYPGIWSWIIKILPSYHLCHLNLVMYSNYTVWDFYILVFACINTVWPSYVCSWGRVFQTSAYLCHPSDGSGTTLTRISLRTGSLVYRLLLTTVWATKTYVIGQCFKSW